MEKIKKHMVWLIATGMFLILTAVMLFYLLTNEKSETDMATAGLPEPVKTENKKPLNKLEQKDADMSIMIDIQGSVENPGVYKMNEGDRIVDAIKKAGGFMSDAEIRSVNQAQKISDEMVIYVAKKGEEFEGSAQQTAAKEAKININAADANELQNLNGVGPSKAESILSYREEHGPFTSIEQLLEVRGIGEKTIEQWREKIEF
jgi:competence protein ComEA